MLDCRDLNTLIGYVDFSHAPTVNLRPFLKQSHCLCRCPLDAKGSSSTPDEGPNLETREYIVSRRNDDAKHAEGIQHITPELRNTASRANPVDNVLHEFVSAKFCHRLQETGLLQHPLVATELATYELLRQRWGYNSFQGNPGRFRWVC